MNRINNENDNIKSSMSSNIRGLPLSNNSSNHYMSSTKYLPSDSRESLYQNRVYPKERYSSDLNESDVDSIFIKGYNNNKSSKHNSNHVSKYLVHNLENLGTECDKYNKI